MNNFLEPSMSVIKKHRIAPTLLYFRVMCISVQYIYHVMISEGIVYRRLSNRQRFHCISEMSQVVRGYFGAVYELVMLLFNNSYRHVF